MAIGNFDGVHLGHRAVLRRAVQLARERGLSPLVLTFHPHPTEVLGRGAMPLLTPLPRKLELLQRLEVGVWVEPFTPELAGMSARAFVEELLAGKLHARRVLVGENFRFGHQRQGDLETLRSLGLELGFEASSEPLETDASGPLSSTRARQALAAGDLAEVERVLGRPHALTGEVVHGDHRGRTIGVPTANLAGVEEALPPFGVYAAVVDRAEGGAFRALGPAVVNVGVRPTVAAGLSVEAHLLDRSDDLYGARLRLHLTDRLREERRFSGLAELKQQIERDIAAARAALSAREPDPEAFPAWY